MLNQAQQDLVVMITARLPQSDREPVLSALWARLASRSASDKQLLEAINEAIKAETSGLRDALGLVPKIRSHMTVREAADIYSRSLHADTVQPTRDEEAAIRAQYTPQQLADLYARTRLLP